MSGISLSLENVDEYDSSQWGVFARAVLAELRDLTPVDSGACRKAWVLDVSENLASFSNETFYASFLEHGWSSQAPDGMIQVVMQEFPDMVYDYDLGDERT